MIKVENQTETREFETLEQAMNWAKTLDAFVTIHVNGMELVGRFGADKIEHGRLPDGQLYMWKKRRL